MILKKVAALLAEQFGMEPDEITEDTSLEDLGADSVDIVELSMAMEEEFDIGEMGEDALGKISTVGDLVNYIQGQLSE